MAKGDVGQSYQEIRLENVKEMSEQKELPPDLSHHKDIFQYWITCYNAMTGSYGIGSFMKKQPVIALSLIPSTVPAALFWDLTFGNRGLPSPNNIDKNKGPRDPFASELLPCFTDSDPTYTEEPATTMVDDLIDVVKDFLKESEEDMVKPESSKTPLPHTKLMPGDHRTHVWPEERVGPLVSDPPCKDFDLDPQKAEKPCEIGQDSKATPPCEIGQDYKAEEPYEIGQNQKEDSPCEIGPNQKSASPCETGQNERAVSPFEFSQNQKATSLSKIDKKYKVARPCLLSQDPKANKCCNSKVPTQNARKKPTVTEANV